MARDAIDPARGGVILGNLYYPTRSLSRLYENLVFGKTTGATAVTAINRFMSGLPALFTARALGYTGPDFCLDAACASGPYAIKLACDKLQRGECKRHKERCGGDAPK
jgi:acyl transferase domain-containing protein